MTQECKNQKFLIKHYNWDNLIALDACRFDYFEKLYQEFLSGVLLKARSPASYTIEWCSKVFSGYWRDTIYVSANPYINSKLAVKNLGHKCQAKDHFFKVIDVWERGWNEKKGTVPPKEVNKFTKQILKKFPRKN